MYAKEYSEAAVPARWLEPKKAQNAYEYALKYSHPKRLGLNQETVTNIDKLIVESYSIAHEWLNARLSSNGTVQIVYSESDVAIVDAAVFLAKWQEIFVPSRDDAVVLHNLSAAVLFYCHEEELEIGQRKDIQSQRGLAST